MVVITDRRACPGRIIRFVKSSADVDMGKGIAGEAFQEPAA